MLINQRKHRKDMSELARYRALGTPEELAALLPEPSPLPLPLDDDFHIAAGLLEDDWSPAIQAQGMREEEQWRK